MKGLKNMKVNKKDLINMTREYKSFDKHER